MPIPKDRSYMLTVWLRDEERDALRELADRAGLDVSSYVRTWIRTTATEAGVMANPAKKRSKTP